MKNFYEQMHEIISKDLVDMETIIALTANDHLYKDKKPFSVLGFAFIVEAWMRKDEPVKIFNLLYDFQEELGINQEKVYKIIDIYRHNLYNGNRLLPTDLIIEILTFEEKEEVSTEKANLVFSIITTILGTINIFLIVDILSKL